MRKKDQELEKKNTELEGLVTDLKKQLTRVQELNSKLMERIKKQELEEKTNTKEVEELQEAIKGLRGELNA